jgi:Fe2+ transport system protein B
MPLAEKLQQKSEGMKAKMAEKAEKAEKGKETETETEIEWLLLFLGAGYVNLLCLILTVIGLIPAVGQAIYVVLDPTLDIVATGIFWFYLQSKELSQYWWLAFGGGIANLVPVINWFGWVGCVLILYFLVKAEKIPFVGEAIEKAAKAAPKIK